MIEAFRSWPPRRWSVAVAAAAITVVAVAIPTAMIDNPIFGREIPPEWWAWPSLIISAVLTGLLIATYVDIPGVDVPDPTTTAAAGADRPTRRGAVGGILTFFAVGCPVCNKLVLIALGYTGALSWFRPFQPLLQIVAFVLLTWALRERLVNERSCRIPQAPVSTTG